MTKLMSILERAKAESMVSLRDALRPYVPAARRYMRALYAAKLKGDATFGKITYSFRGQDDQDHTAVVTLDRHLIGYRRAPERPDGIALYVSDGYLLIPEVSPVLKALLSQGKLPKLKAQGWSSISRANVRHEIESALQDLGYRKPVHFGFVDVTQLFEEKFERELSLQSVTPIWARGVQAAVLKFDATGGKVVGLDAMRLTAGVMSVLGEVGFPRFTRLEDEVSLTAARSAPEVAQVLIRSVSADALLMPVRLD